MAGLGLGSEQALTHFGSGCGIARLGPSYGRILPLSPSKEKWSWWPTWCTGQEKNPPTGKSQWARSNSKGCTKPALELISSALVVVQLGIDDGFLNKNI